MVSTIKSQLGNEHPKMTRDYCWRNGNVEVDKENKEKNPSPSLTRGEQNELLKIQLKSLYAETLSLHEKISNNNSIEMIHS
jgi:hypothetical protein